MSRGFLLLTTLPIVIGLSAADDHARVRAKDLPAPAPIKELWQPPARISAQDLFHGPWGNADAPDAAATYRFQRSKRRGVNPGMTVVDQLGREWSVKQAPHDSRGAEGPIEVVLSRVLSAVGYHQPPVYYLPGFTMADTFGTRHEPGGRFRLKVPDLKERTTWSWGENPFVGMRPHQGLLVILIMFNSADLKNSNIRSQGVPVFAAEFLHEFAGEGPWAHIDMAGTGFFTWPRHDYLWQRGGTGYGVRLICELADRLAATT